MLQVLAYPDSKLGIVTDVLDNADRSSITCLSCVNGQAETLMKWLLGLCKGLKPLGPPRSIARIQPPFYLADAAGLKAAKREPRSCRLTKEKRSHASQQLPDGKSATSSVDFHPLCRSDKDRVAYTLGPE
jgi:hypothetical protein